MSKTIKIEMNEDQAMLIKNALDFYSRILMGQWKNIEQLITTIDPHVLEQNSEMDFKSAEAHLSCAREILMPRLDSGNLNSSLGITNSYEPAKKAYELLKWIQHAIHKANNFESSFSNEIKLTDQPKPKIDVIEND